LRKDQQRGDQPFHEREHDPARECGKNAGVCDAGGRGEDLVKHEPDQAGHDLDDGVPEERLGQLLRASSHRERTERHPAEEDDQHDYLRVRAVSDEQPEVPRPDGLVHESGGSGQNENERKKQGHRGREREMARGLPLGLQDALDPTACIGALACRLPISGAGRQAGFQPTYQEMHNG
jgi:hypothetical protein